MTLELSDAEREIGESRISTDPPARGFTSAEYEVAQLLMQGFSNQEIATRLGIAIDTLNKHLTRIFQKCGRHSRVAVVVYLHDSRHLLGLKCLSCDM